MFLITLFLLGCCASAIAAGCPNPPPAAPAGSTSDYNGSSLLVTYTCNDGLGFPSTTGSKRNVQMKCNSEGTWEIFEGQQLQDCIQIRCSTSPPAAPVGCTSDYNGSSVLNTVVTYSCSDGWSFPLGTDSKPYVQVKCNSDGTWTVLEGQQLENCTRIGCSASPPEAPVHSTSDYNGSSVLGTVVTYTCNDGLSFPSTTGSKPNVQVKCNTEGTWEVIEGQQLQDCIPIELRAYLMIFINADEARIQEMLKNVLGGNRVFYMKDLYDEDTINLKAFENEKADEEIEKATEEEVREFNQLHQDAKDHVNRDDKIIGFLEKDYTNEEILEYFRNIRWFLEHLPPFWKTHL